MIDVTIRARPRRRGARPSTAPISPPGIPARPASCWSSRLIPTTRLSPSTACFTTSSRRAGGCGWPPSPTVRRPIRRCPGSAPFAGASWPRRSIASASPTPPSSSPGAPRRARRAMPGRPRSAARAPRGVVCHGSWPRGAMTAIRITRRVGRAAAAVVARAGGAPIRFFPVWAWHWAAPGSPGARTMLAAAERRDLSLHARSCQARRARAHSRASRTAPSVRRSCRSHVLDRFARPFEVLLR